METNKLDAHKTEITTAVAYSSFNSIIDVECIFEYLKIDNEILGTKWHGNTKGNIKTVNCFFNQVTIPVFVKSDTIGEVDKEVNVKIFSNGSAQLSGIKTIKHGNRALKILLDKISVIKGIKENVPIIIENGIIYDKKDYDLFNGDTHTRFSRIKIYGKKTDDTYFKVVGERKGNDFYIWNGNDRENVLPFEVGKYKSFVQNKHTKDHTKLVFDANGQNIGLVKFIFRKIRKNLVIMGNSFIEDKITDFVSASDEKENLLEHDLYKTYSIYDRSKRFIGKKCLFLKKMYVLNQADYELNNISIRYSAIETINTNYDFDVEISNINCKFFMFDKITGKELKFKSEIVHETLLNKYNLNSSFEPSKKYQGLILKLYFDEEYKTLLKETNCYFKATAMIFRNGKVLMSGCTNKNHITIVKKYILDLYNENYDLFLNDFIPETCEIVDPDITIFDLL